MADDEKRTARASTIAVLAALLGTLLVGCEKKVTTTTAPIPMESGSAPSAGAASASAAPASSSARAFHYDMVLTISEGAKSSRTTFTLDLSEHTPGRVSIGRNVAPDRKSVIRADVNTIVDAKLTMKGDAPELEVDARLSVLDAANELHPASPKGTAVTPLGATTTVFDRTIDGRKFELKATPTAVADLGGKSADRPTASYRVVAVVTQGGATEKSTALNLIVTNFSPATDRSFENIALPVNDGRGAPPRVDVGTGMKVTGRPRAAGIELDFDFELKAAEATMTSHTIRGIRANGSLFAPFDKSTMAFTADYDGQRYEVKLTPHRPL